MVRISSGVGTFPVLPESNCSRRPEAPDELVVPFLVPSSVRNPRGVQSGPRIASALATLGSCGICSSSHPEDSSAVPSAERLTSLPMRSPSQGTPPGFVIWGIGHPYKAVSDLRFSGVVGMRYSPVAFRRSCSYLLNLRWVAAQCIHAGDTLGSRAFTVQYWSVATLQRWL